MPFEGMILNHSDKVWVLEVKGRAKVETMYVGQLTELCTSTLYISIYVCAYYVYWTNFKVLSPFTAVASKIVSQPLERRELL